MSGSLHAWYSQRDLESLAERDGVLSGELQLSKLTRLVGMLHSDAGSVRASLKFRQRRDGRAEVELTYAAAVELTCQRCLEPFRHELAGRVNVVLVDAGSTPDTVPEGYEPFELVGWPVLAGGADRGRADRFDAAGAEARAARRLW